jgi:excisionase family DNA binding protein
VNEVKLLTVKEASTATTLSKSKIYQLLDQKILRRVRLPGCAKVLIAEAELKRYVNEGVQAGV